MDTKGLKGLRDVVNRYLFTDRPKTDIEKQAKKLKPVPLLKLKGGFPSNNLSGSGSSKNNSLLKKAEEYLANENQKIANTSDKSLLRKAEEYLANEKAKGEEASNEKKSLLEEAVESEKAKALGGNKEEPNVKLGIKDREALRNAEEYLNGGWESLSNISRRFTFDEDKARNQDGLKTWSPSNSKERRTLSPEGYFRHGETLANRAKLRAQFIKAYRDKYGEEPSEKEIAEIEKRAENAKMWQGSIPSTAIKEARYDPSTKEMQVKFNGKGPSSNTWYSYPGVPTELVRKFRDAISKGEFFLRNIHDQYTTNPGHKRKK